MWEGERKVTPKKEPRLARFRADPRKIRVSICTLGSEWYATVWKRADPGKYIDFIGRGGSTPRIAIDRALVAAEELGWDGIDLNMDWSYEHPFP